MSWPRTKVLEELLQKHGKTCRLLRSASRLTIDVAGREFVIEAQVFEDTETPLLSIQEVGTVKESET